MYLTPNFTRSQSACLHATNSSCPASDQHPHPFAPSELRQSFEDFVRKFRASGSSSASTSSSASSRTSGAAVYEEFWQAPERLWKKRFDEAEMDAITVRFSFSSLWYLSAMLMWADRAEEHLCIRRSVSKARMCMRTGMTLKCGAE